MTWIAIRTSRSRERAVATALAGCGALTFFPTETRWRQKGGLSDGTRIRVQVPLIARYVFASFYWEIPWEKLRGITGLEGVVMVDGRVGLIGERAMRHFMELCAEYRSIRPGGKVAILHGAFADHMATVETVFGHQAKVLVSIFNTKTTVSIGLDALEAA